jgi:MYXO-CTERM domain-containing protein
MKLRRVLFALAALTAGNALGADPLEPVLLAQSSSPGIVLAIEANASGDTVYLGASSDAGTCGAASTYTLEAEVRPASTAFSDVPTHTSAVLAKPSCVTVEYALTAISGLAAGAYKWQVRENVDGVRSRWVQFNAGLTAFRVPDIAVAPPSLAFGDVRTGTTSPTRAIALTNLSRGAVTITGVAARGPFQIVGGPALPLTLNPGGNAIFALSATPLAAGTQQGSFTADSTHASSPHSADLAVIGTEPRLQLDTAAVSFGEAVIGAGAYSRSVTLRNAGTATLDIEGAAIASPFSFGGLAGVSLAPDATHTFALYYAPTSPGAHASTLSIASDDPRGPYALQVSGSAIDSARPSNQPALFLSPAAQDFGSVRVGESRAVALTFSNGGDAALNVNGLSLDGDQASEFAVDLPALPFAVSPGGSAQVVVRFSPAAVGARAAALRIESDKYPAGTGTVALSGWGHGPKLSVASTSLDFGSLNVGRSVERTFDVINQGSAAATVSALSFQGSAAADFSSPQGAPFTVQPGAIRTLSVVFKPSAAGQRTSMLALASDDPVTPGQGVALAGFGLWPEALSSPSAVVFGRVRLGQAPVQSVAVRNIGDGPLTLTSVTITGADAVAFKVSGVNAPVMLQPGASAIIAQVSFQPSSVGGASADLIFGSADVQSPSLKVPLSGEGIAPAIAISAPAIDFGGQLVNRPSAPRTVVVTNTGTAPLLVSTLSLAGVAATSFAITLPAAPFSLGVGESRTIYVVAHPWLVGELSARLVLGTDVPGAATAQVKLLTLGLSRTLSVTATAIEFGAFKAGTPREPVAVTFHNLSSDALSLAPAKLIGPSADQFSVELGASQVAPLGSVTALVHYQPSSAGAHTASLLLASTDAQVPAAAVQLSGLATSSILDVSPSSFEFGPLIVGSTVEQVFMLTNKTSAPVTVVALGASDPEFAPLAGAPLTIGGGQSAALTVAFTPRAKGLAFGTVAVTLAGRESDGPEIAIPLRGTGSVAAEARSGCTAGGTGTAAWAWLAVIAALGLRRRK